jgi:hypothetical protein
MIEIAVLNSRGRALAAGLTSPALGVGHTLKRVATMGHDPFPAIHRAGQNSEPIEIDPERTAADSITNIETRVL